MTLPGILASSFLFGCPIDCKSGSQPTEKQQRIAVALAATATVFDALASITTLVLGILGAVSTIAMSPAAAYSLIGISCTITLAWLLLAIIPGIRSCINKANNNKSAKYHQQNLQKPNTL